MLLTLASVGLKPHADPGPAIVQHGRDRARIVFELHATRAGTLRAVVDLA